MEPIWFGGEISTFALVHCKQPILLGCVVVQAPRVRRAVHNCTQKRLSCFIVAVHAPAEYIL